MACDLTAPEFSNEEAAIAHMEASRWPNGAHCPHCGSTSVHKMGGATQAGMFLCNDCRDKFTVRTGTVFERSHIPLHKWLLAMHLIAASKKGVSAHQLHRMLKITYKTAWFMAHRIREAMAPSPAPPKMGGGGGIVEADETEITLSRKTRSPNRAKRSDNKRFLALIERDGFVRSKVITERGLHEVRGAIWTYVDKTAVLHTDGAKVYMGMMPIGQHEVVDHDKMFARDSNRGRVHINTAEGYFGLFKRGLVGTYQHIDERHLPRYLAEFDFRMNNRVKLGIGDAERAARILKGAEGKRLAYRQPY